jgi:hypothetical protein
MKNILILFAAAIAMLSLSCSVQKTADEMRDTTNKISQKSDQLLGATCKLARLGLKGGAYDLFKDAIDLKALFNPEVRGAEKLGYAQVVFEAMFWQSWDSRCGDTLDRLDWYYMKSVLLLFSQIHDHINDTFPVDTTTINPLDDNEWNGLAALGAKMDVVDPDYEAAMKAAKLPVMSFYDLLISALEQEDAYNRGEPVADYVKEVLKWKPEMVYLLQLRHNYLSGIIMVLATDIEDSLVSMGKLLVFNRDVFMENETARIDQYLLWAKDIQKTRADLKRLGYKVQINSKYATAMGHIQWKRSTTKELPEKVRSTENEFIKIYSEIVTENAKLLADQQPTLFGVHGVPQP